MLERIKSFIETRTSSNKSLLRLVIRRLSQDEIFDLQRITHAWKIPGKISTLPGSVISIELEGDESLLNAKLSLLKQHPRIGLRPMEIKWRPYTGEYKFFTVVFA